MCVNIDVLGDLFRRHGAVMESAAPASCGVGLRGCVIHGTDTSAPKWKELFVFNNARREGCSGRGGWDVARINHDKHHPVSTVPST